MKAALIWGALLAAIAIPIVAATFSPYLAFRQPIYIAAGFAGIVGLCLLLVQPLLAESPLPGLSVRGRRRLHRWVGAGLVVAVVVHVAGLWITSPPDVIDALTFTSPTPFSAWGVIAMWAVFASALWAATRMRWRSKLQVWRSGHRMLGLIIISSTVIHTILIEGAMETFTKIGLCLAVLGTAFFSIVWPKMRSRR